MWKDKKLQEKQRQQQILAQEQISARSWKTAHELLVMTTEFLEKYIEKAGYYSDWERRKQIRDNRVRRNDKNLEDAEKSFSTMLFLFGSNLEGKQPELRNELKNRFYQWVDATGIEVNNCPERLKNVLFGINEILEGRGEKILEDVKNAKRDYEVGSSEYAEALNDVFTGTQNPMDKLEEEEKFLEGKDWKQVTLENKFGNGDSERGDKAFKQIKAAIDLSNHQKNFHYFPQKEQQLSIKQGRILTEKIKQNLDEWNLKEVVVFKGYFDGRGEQKELALVHQEANLRSYNWQGHLEVDPRMIYFKKDHQPEEWVQIEQYYSNKVGSSSAVQSNNPQSPTNSEIIHDVKNNPQNWRIDEIITEFDNFGTKKEIVLIHRSARLDDYDQRTGKLNFDGNPIYRTERFNQAETVEINWALNISQTSVSTSSQQYFTVPSQKSVIDNSTKSNDNQDIGAGKVFGIIGIISILLIGGVVVIRKKLNKKLKK